MMRLSRCAASGWLALARPNRSDTSATNVRTGTKSRFAAVLAMHEVRQFLWVLLPCAVGMFEACC
jgi:hypothetical protein